MGNSEKLRTWAPLGLAVLLVGVGATSASADSINYLYNNIPGAITTNPPSPTNEPLDFSSSLGLDSVDLDGVGGLISLAGGAGQTNGGQIGLSNWGAEQTYNPTNANTVTCVGGTCSGMNTTGFYTNVTVSAYNYDPASGVGATPDTTYSPTTLIASQTSNVFIDWRPAADTTPGDGEFTCSDGQTSFENTTSSTEQCGLVNLVNFNLSANLPSSFIFEISYLNGDTPTDPDNSLNVGLNPLNPTVGTNPQPDTAYIDFGIGPVGTTGVGLDGVPTISFEASTPEPATFGLIGFGLLGLGIVARKKKNDKV